MPLNDKKSMIKRLQEQLPFTDISKKELANAVEKAYAELDHYKDDVRKFGEKNNC